MAQHDRILKELIELLPVDLAETARDETSVLGNIVNMMVYKLSELEDRIEELADQSVKDAKPLGSGAFSMPDSPQLTLEFGPLDKAVVVDSYAKFVNLYGGYTEPVHEHFWQDPTPSKTYVRIDDVYSVCAVGGDEENEDPWTIQAGPPASWVMYDDDKHSIQMNEVSLVSCLDCSGKGEVDLFISRVTCTVCSGSGKIPE